MFVQSSPNKVTAALGRRDFIKLSAGASLIATSACSAANWLDSGPPAGLMPVGPIALDKRRFYVLACLVEAMYPGRADWPAGLTVGAPQRIDRELYFIAQPMRKQILLALDILEYGGIFAGWLGRFSRLTPARRLQALEQMLNHRWQTYRQVATALTQLVKGMYFADRSTWAAIGYDGPWQPAKPPESIAAYPHFPPRKS